MKCRNCIVGCFSRGDKKYKGLIRENFMFSKKMKPKNAAQIIANPHYINSLTLAIVFKFCPKCGGEINWDKIGENLDKIRNERNE